MRLWCEYLSNDTELRQESNMNDNMCEYDEAFTQDEMLEETGFCKDCKLDCPNRGKE